MLFACDKFSNADRLKRLLALHNLNYVVTVPQGMRFIFQFKGIKFYAIFDPRGKILSVSGNGGSWGFSSQTNPLTDRIISAVDAGIQTTCYALNLEVK